MSDRCDIVIVGAGMAGASLAAEIGTEARVLVAETEPQPGCHATGRSAAFWTESYGGRDVLPLTAASGGWLHEHGFLAPRGALTIARAGDEARTGQFAAEFAALGVRVEQLDRRGLEAVIPGLLPAWTTGAFEPDCCDIDVAAMHQHYLVRARAEGCDVRCHAELVRAVRDGRGWLLDFADGTQVHCRVLVNAAGAWADEVAVRAGVARLGIVPLRRTIAQVRTSPAPSGSLPLVLDSAGAFYFKPESGRLWLSPHDETPSPPCDAAPDEIDVATAIARLAEVASWHVEAVEHRWAGLRSFAPDRLPVFGFDPANPGFFWFAGQGGFGIQTAPAAARLAAGLLLGSSDHAIDPARYAPTRFF